MVKSEHSHTPETERRIERERERSVTITRPCCTDQHLLVFDIVFFCFFFLHAFGSDTHGPQRAAFPRRRQQSALCL